MLLMSRFTRNNIFVLVLSENCFPQFPLCFHFSGGTVGFCSITQLIGVRSQFGRKFCSFPLSRPIYFDNNFLFVIM